MHRTCPDQGILPLVKDLVQYQRSFYIHTATPIILGQILH
jgi:hypothetical protein